jgi:hypothetical protein
LPFAWSGILLDVDDDEGTPPHVGVAAVHPPAVVTSGSVGSVGSVRAPGATVDASVGRRRHGPPSPGHESAGPKLRSAAPATPPEGHRRHGPPPVGRGPRGPKPPKPPPPGFVPP